MNKLKNFFSVKKNLLLVTGTVILIVVLTLILTKVFTFKEKPKNVNLSTCATVETKKSIKLPSEILSRDEVLETTPVTVEVSEKCDKSSEYHIYLNTSGDIDETKIRYIVTKHNTKEVISEGVLGNLNSLLGSYTPKEINDVKTALKGELKSVYLIFNKTLNAKDSFDIYIYLAKDLIGENKPKGDFKAILSIKNFIVETNQK